MSMMKSCFYPGNHHPDTGKISATQCTSCDTSIKSSGNYFANLNTYQICDLIDESIENMSKPWRGKLSFSVYRWTDGIDCNDMYSGSPDDVDICDFLNGGMEVSRSCISVGKNSRPPKIRKCSTNVVGG